MGSQIPLIAYILVSMVGYHERLPGRNLYITALETYANDKYLYSRRSIIRTFKGIGKKFIILRVRYIERF